MGFSINGPGVHEESGPASSTDNAVVRWDGTGGIKLQDSGVTVDDSGNMTVSGTGLNTVAGALTIGGETQKLAALTVQPKADFTATGTTSVNASTTMTGSGTAFLTEIGIGDRVSVSTASSTYAYVTAIASNTSLTLSKALGDGTSQTISVKKAISRLDTTGGVGAGSVAVDDQGILLVGYPTAGDVGITAASTSNMQIRGTGTGLDVFRYANGTGGANINLRKSRSATVGTGTVITTGDEVGKITFQAIGTDGAAYTTGALITATSEGTIGSAIIPSKVTIGTANSSGTVTTAVTVDSSQNVGLGIAPSSAKLHVQGSSSAYAIKMTGDSGTANKNYGFSVTSADNLTLERTNSTLTAFQVSSTDGVGIRGACPPNYALYSDAVLSGYGAIVGVGGTGDTGNLLELRKDDSTVVTSVSGAGNLAVSGTAIITGVTTLTGGLKGTTTNDDATALNVGQYAEALVTSATNVPGATGGHYGDATSLSLTAGDWDITGIVTLVPNGASIAGDYIVGISTTTGDSSTGLTDGVNMVHAASASTVSRSAVVPSYRVSLSGTTTHYLKLQVQTYTVATPQYTCRLSARRMR